MTLKASLSTEPEVLTEEEMKHRVKVIQYEALMLTDVKEFKKGQVF